MVVGKTHSRLSTCEGVPLQPSRTRPVDDFDQMHVLASSHHHRCQSSHSCDCATGPENNQRTYHYGRQSGL